MSDNNVSHVRVYDDRQTERERERKSCICNATQNWCWWRARKKERTRAKKLLKYVLLDGMAFGSRLLLKTALLSLINALRSIASKTCTLAYNQSTIVLQSFSYHAFSANEMFASVCTFSTSFTLEFNECGSAYAFFCYCCCIIFRIRRDGTNSIECALQWTSLKVRDPRFICCCFYEKIDVYVGYHDKLQSSYSSTLIIVSFTSTSKSLPSEAFRFLCLTPRIFNDILCLHTQTKTIHLLYDLLCVCVCVFFIIVFVSTR